MSLYYIANVGNIYTGSLFLGLLSLLENNNTLEAGNKIGLYSYGSGAVAEVFSLTLVEGYKDQLRNNRFDDFDKRTRISIDEYEKCSLEILQWTKKET